MEEEEEKKRRGVEQDSIFCLRPSAKAGYLDQIITRANFHV